MSDHGPLTVVDTQRSYRPSCFSSCTFSDLLILTVTCRRTSSPALWRAHLHVTCTLGLMVASHPLFDMHVPRSPRFCIECIFSGGLICGSRAYAVNQARSRAERHWAKNAALCVVWVSTEIRDLRLDNSGPCQCPVRRLGGEALSAATLLASCRTSREDKTDYTPPCLPSQEKFLVLRID